MSGRLHHLMLRRIVLRPKHRSSTLHALYADPSTNDLGDSICGLSRGEVLEARADRRGLYRTAAETQLKDVLLELGGLRNFPAANHADRAAEVKRIADEQSTLQVYKASCERRWG